MSNYIKDTKIQYNLTLLTSGTKRLANQLNSQTYYFIHVLYDH